MTLSFFTAVLLPCCMLIPSLLMVSRMRLGSMIVLFRLQAVALCVYAFALAIELEHYELFVIALLVFSVKVVVVPMFLKRVAERTGASERLSSFLRPTTLTFLGVAVAAGAFYAADAVAQPGRLGYLIIAVSFTLISLGLLTLIVRTDMFSQALGFFVMENGIFTFGLALTGGMPLIVEFGTFLDALILFVLVIVLVSRVQTEHRTVTTDRLRSLID